MDIQEAIEQPRFATFSFPNSFAPYTHLPGRLNIEARLPDATIDELRRRGHDVEMWPALTRRACSVEAILLDSRTGFLPACRNFQVVMAGTPFPNLPPADVQRALLPVMQAAKPRPNLTFTYADPPERPRPYYRMVLVFDAANDLTAMSVCAGTIRHKPPVVG